MKIAMIALATLLACICFGEEKKSDIEEVKYRRLQATPDQFTGKLVMVKCEIVKYVADRNVLDAFCGSVGDSTSGPCIYDQNNWICLAVPKDKKEMINYLIDELTPGSSSPAMIVGRLTNKKYFKIEEIRFCTSNSGCKPYGKILK
jgi:hypothetical protein